jgi:pimeloyl-ACP methyl ester carboxylesterase
MPDLSRFPHHTELRVAIAGGDEVLVRDFGPDDAPAVIYHHDTPSCSYDLPSGWGNKPDGVRLITFDRPGYGASPHVAGRSVADAGRWSAAIADALGIDRFAVMGTSGGGPHAAAAAAVLTDRITRLCVSVGLGPVSMDGFNWEAAMPAETVDEMRCAIQGEAELRAFIDAMMKEEDPLAVWMEQLPASDKEILARPEVAAEEELITEGAIGHGPDGWVEDDLAFFNRDWGVDLSAITADTLFLYGSADVFVPHNHGDAMRRAIGHGRLVKVADGGHWMRDIEPAVLSWLAAADGTAFALPATHRSWSA